MALFTSVARKEIIETINKIFGHVWKNVRIKVHSEPVALFRALEGALDYEDGFLLLDVGGEVTEIFLIRKFMIEDMATFGRGGNFLARRLASRLNMPLEEAASLIRLDGRGDGKESLREKLNAVLEDAGKEWLEYFSKALAAMCRQGYLPSTLMFLGGGAGIDALKKRTEGENLSKFTILGKPFKVQTLLPENLRSNLEGSLFDRKDPQMTLPLLLVLASAKEYGI